MMSVVIIDITLAPRMDATLGEEVVHFESDQLVTLDPDPTRHWRTPAALPTIDSLQHGDARGSRGGLAVGGSR